MFKPRPPMAYLTNRKIPLMNGKKGNKTGRFLFDNMWNMFYLSRFPILNKFSWWHTDKSDIRWVPTAENIELPESAPLPIEILHRFIEEASHRVIITSGCGCRIACNCQNYPQEIGCLFLGDSAPEMDETISREVSIEEAKAHVKWGIDSGLVPLIGKVRQDNTIFGVKDRHRLVTVCFCCECCCISRHLRYAKLDDLEQLFTKFEGVHMEVTDDCVGCGKCVEVCYTKAMSMPYGKAQIGDYCRACGRCVSVCPQNAIKLRIDDPEYIEKARDRILAHTSHLPE
ncbi:MAG: 4Fe-4S binding protein [Actinobacteria bacterium]|nr:4Fe-4S binding protein [Actinomycetota bacterium]